MKYFNQLADQLKNSKLTVKYSETNGSELACVWEDNSEAESLLVINRIRVNETEIIQHIETDKYFREELLNQFLNPNNDDEKQSYLKANLEDIVNREYHLLDKFIYKKRGKIIGEKFGF